MSVLAIVSDLMFTSKIRAAAGEAQAEVYTVKRASDIEGLKSQGTKIDVIVVDLEARSFDSFDVLRSAKEAFPEIPSVGFYSHVNEELAARGEEAGVLQTMPRSQFVKRLPQIVRGA